MNCYFEMPYFKGFRFELENLGGEPCNGYYQIDCEEKQLPENALYFHAQFRRVNPLPYKENYVILNNIKGNGHYVGTYMHWGVKNNRWWGEGEIKFYIDGDTQFPSICGTGTEDYFCGAYNFDVNGEYKGCYTLTEHIGIHNNCVDEDDFSLLQLTVKRALELDIRGKIYIITLKKQMETVLEECRDFLPGGKIAVIPEPEARNTAPAIGLAARYMELSGEAHSHVA